MRYKVGDKVKIKSLDWFKANEYSGQGMYDDVLAFLKMTDECCGKELTIDFIFADERGTGYIMKEPEAHWRFTDSMIECLVERNGKTYPYKIGDRVILKGNNRRATITDLKYNSWGNLSYYIKIDNDKDITVDYPTELLLPYDNVVKDVVDTKPQVEQVSSKHHYIGKYVHAGGELNGIVGYIVDVKHESDDIFGEELWFYIKDEEDGTIHRYCKEEIQEIVIGITYKDLE